jgi:hypothetical protein
MEKYLKIAARAWAGATLNIKKFADAYVEAVGKFREKAMERFSAAYPMFGEREWRRLGQIGAGSLLPQFFFKSDFFVGKLLNLNSSIRIQKALVGASNDGRIRVDRGNGPEKVRIADLTRKEEKALILLLSEENEKLSPEELKLKYRELVARVNKSNSTHSVKWEIRMVDGARVAHFNRSCNVDILEIDKVRREILGGSRTSEDILQDLVVAVIRLNSLRDDEWEFQEDHGSNSDFWDDEVNKAHDDLLDNIQAARDDAKRLVREATGNDRLEV